MMTQKTTLIALVFIAGVLSYVLQTHFFLEADVIYLIHAAEKLLQGGHYTTDFFETNPPMILYLYAPIVLIKNYFALNAVLVARLYIIALIGVSFFFSAVVLAQAQIPRFEQMAVLISLLLVLFFLPLCEFGQREHLLVILTMPYWLAVAFRPSRKTLFMVGLMAGIGLSLKPFFLMPFLLVELYFFMMSKTVKTLFRLETVTVMLVMSVYLLTILLFQSDYVSGIFPFVWRYYYLGAAEPQLNLIAQPAAIFCFTVLLLGSFLIIRGDKNPILHIMLCVLAGFLIAYDVQQSSWYYHLYPAFAIACLTCILIASYAHDLIIGALASMVFLSVPIYQAAQIYFSWEKSQNQHVISLINYVDIEFTSAKVYCFPRHYACSLLSQYAHARYVSRFPSQWALRGLDKVLTAPLPFERAHHDQRYLLALIAEDIERTAPHLVIFDMSIPTAKLKNAHDYIAYLSVNKSFSKNWAKYQFVKAIGPYALYRTH